MQSSINAGNKDVARHILVIDDNDSIHGDFRKVFGSDEHSDKLAGAKAALFGDAAPTAKSAALFEVDSASQGHEGLAKLQDALRQGKPYAVAFVDMRMPPGWDGVETIQKLWEVDPDLQVVICSAYSDYTSEQIAAKLRLAEPMPMLKKPFDPVEVMQLATTLSTKSSQRRQDSASAPR